MKHQLKPQPVTYRALLIESVLLIADQPPLNVSANLWLGEHGLMEQIDLTDSRGQSIGIIANAPTKILTGVIDQTLAKFTELIKQLKKDGLLDSKAK